ncbi:hypothetical protein [Ruminococcus intestinalis]|uniref:hypothetical protein n=1 Tax=Ruminococcus intestinalis TaxID=2763066 RepID=UPI003F7D3F7E
MSVQPYPWTVRIYKGEGRFLIVEEVEHRAGYNTYSDKITIVSEAEDNLVAKLGTETFLGLKSIEDSPLYVGKPKQFWKNGSKYKGYITFWKHNNLASVRLYQNQSYEVYSSEKCREKKGGYNGCIKSINLPAKATAEEIGNAIIDVFKAAEEYYERNPMEY